MKSGSSRFSSGGIESRRSFAAENRAAQAEQLRAIERLELAEVQKEVESLRKRNVLLEATVANQIKPDRSPKEVADAKAAEARAVQSKTLAQAARDEARTRADAAEKDAADARADAKHAEKHADQRVREAERVRDDALAKAKRARAEGVKAGIDTMQRAFASALLMEQRGEAPGSVVVLNADKEPIDERVMDKAWSLVGKLADLREDDK